MLRMLLGPIISLNYTKEPKLLSRLVALLALGGKNQKKKIEKLAAQVLLNITLESTTLKYFLCLERDLFIIASCNEGY